MEDLELKHMWKAYEEKLHSAKILNLQSWAVNLQTVEYVQNFKVQSKLNSLSEFKTWAIALGMLWIIFLGALIVANHFENIYFSGSIGMLMLFCVLAIAVYIKHILLIRNLDYGDPVTTTQMRLTELQASTIQVTRILWLQLPFYTTFFWSNDFIHDNSNRFWFIALPLTLIFTLLAIRLYKNISFKNADKKWFKILFGSKEWTSIVSAKKYLSEIEEFRLS